MNSLIQEIKTTKNLIEENVTEENLTGETENLTGETENLTGETENLTGENNQLNELNNNRLDKLLLNLRTISEIKENDKLKVNEESLLIDQSSFQFIRRWYNSENRGNTLTKINDMIDDIFAYIEIIKNNKYENANRDIQRILVGLTTSVKGIDNLKVTYKKDVNIITKLTLYTEKLNMKINELNTLINIL